MPSNILAFGLPEVIRTICIPRDRLLDFLNDREKWPLLAEERDWLDAKAPGWFLDARVQHRDPGCDTMDVDLLVFLQNHQQRTAWRARLIEENEDELKRIEESSGGKIQNARCPRCGDQMQSYEGDGIVRIAQFAFIVKERGLKCPCDHMLTKHSPLLYPVMDQISQRVGLPLPGESGWSESITDERIRRRSSPAEIEIVLCENDTPQEILEKLDRMIKSQKNTQKKSTCTREAETSGLESLKPDASHV